MQVIKVSFNAVAPIFMLMAVGYILKSIHFFKDNTVQDFNKLSFNVLLPAFCITNVYGISLDAGSEIKAVIFMIGIISAVFFAAWFITTRFENDRTRIPVIIQGIFKCNFVIMGAQIGTSVYGTNLGILALLFPFVTLCNNIYSAFIFEYYRGGKASITKILLNFVRNPIIVGTVTGLIINILDIHIPDIVYSGVLKKLSDMATPVALIALGASFEFSEVLKDWKYLARFVICRQALLPLISVPLAVMCGLRSKALVAVAIFAAGPNAVNSYPTAVAMGGDSKLANEFVVVTSVTCIISLFVTFCIIGATVGLY